MYFIGEERIVQRGHFRILIVMPVIYSMIVPLVLIDLTVSFYQWICFWAYGIPYVKRGKYIQHLHRGGHMVHPWDRLNCLYCSYANGVIAYVPAILVETEKYWCPIKYQARKNFTPPHPQGDFADPDDEKALRKIVKGG